MLRCSSDNINIEPLEELSTTTEISEEKAYEKGFVRIKVAEELSTRMEQATRSGGSATRGMNADAILDKVKVREMQRTFPYAGRFEERTRKEGLHLWYDVHFDSEVPLAQIQSELQMIDGVGMVELRPVVFNYGNGKIIKYVKEIASSFANNNHPFDDPYLPDQWHYHNDGSHGPKYIPGADINLYHAWQKETGSPEVIISIVDGGIQYDHEDLAANMWINTAEKDGVTQKDDDNNGYVDDIHGYNFVARRGRISPESHGTHVAGTVAAVNNNAIGVGGVAGGDGSPNSGARVMSCQIFVEEDDPYVSSNGRGGAEAIKYGADNGAVISQNSWGYDEIDYTPQSDKEAIDYFIKYAGIDENGNQTGPMKGGLVVFAAGNENNRHGYPASYEPVLSVSAIAPDYKKAWYSNFGNWVSVAAPGGDHISFGADQLVLSTALNNEYAYMQGTSMACPHVSGVAALLISKMKGPGLTPDIIFDAIVSSGKNINEYNQGFTNRLGLLVDASAALSIGGSIAPDQVMGLEGTVQSNTINLSWTIPNDEDDVIPAGFRVFISKEPIGDINPADLYSNIVTQTFKLNSGSPGDTFEAKIVDLEFSTDYYIAVSAYDLGGNFSILSNEINLTTGSNNPPSISTNDQTSFTLRSHEAYTINLTGFDEDDHELTWSVSPQIEGVTLLVEKDDQAKLSINPVFMDPQQYFVEVVLQDKYLAEARLPISFTVLPNTPPKNIKVIDNQIIIGTGQQQTFTLNEYITDEDGEELQYQFNSSNTRVVTLEEENGVATLTTIGYGLTDITVTAIDAKGETAVQEFKVLVKASDSPLDLYPNPMKDKLWVRTNKDAQCEVVIHNSAGAEVHNETITSSPFAPHAIDVSSYAGGLYQVTVKIDGVEHKKQIIKQ